jgi:hypothetical protein
MSDEIEKLLDSLTPADTGWDTVANKLIRFEGFTDACWEAAIEEEKTVDDLESEIVADWGLREETRGLILLESGWWTPNIFYAVYRN